MNGTNSSTSGFRRIAGRWPRWNRRLLLFALLVVALMFVIVRIQTNVGRDMAALEQEFGTVQTEDLYTGVQARVHLHRLNDQLLEFQLKGISDSREKFLKESEDFRQWLKERKAELDTPREHEQFEQVMAAYDQYLAETKPLLQSSTTTADTLPFNVAYKTVQQKTLPLLNRIESFITAQKAAFAELLQTSRDNLLALRRLLTLSLLLLLASTVTLVVLVYRGMIGPLRRVLAQSQIVIERQEKLASLGTLAAGVAHEIRNPLTAIKLRLFTLRGMLPAEFAANEDLAVVSSEVNRLERIVKDFLQFARPSDPDLTRLPAEHLLQEVRDLLARSLEKSAIRLDVEPSNPIWVSADHQQIKQVIINLVQNAAESICRNGTITLRAHASNEALDGGLAPVAILSLTDTGAGISPEVEKRMFDPFFTTKEGGTGLGLAVAARIVAAHGGILRYRTRLNQGTTFEIVLPKHDEDGTTTPAH